MCRPPRIPANLEKRTARRSVPSIINGLCQTLNALKSKKVLVAMEATGAYETLLVKCLASHRIDVAVLNPRQIREFAKGIGMDAKTDPIDAQLTSMPSIW